MLVDELKQEGFDVCEAEDADQAIALIHEPPKGFHSAGHRYPHAGPSEWAPRRGPDAQAAPARPDHLRHGSTRCPVRPRPPWSEGRAVGKAVYPIRTRGRGASTSERVTSRGGAELAATLHTEAMQRRELPAWIVFQDEPEHPGKVIVLTSAPRTRCSKSHSPHRNLWPSRTSSGDVPPIVEIRRLALPALSLCRLGVSNPRRRATP